jgi:hypothetical protein
LGSENRMHDSNDPHLDWFVCICFSPWHSLGRTLVMTFKSESLLSRSLGTFSSSILKQSRQKKGGKRERKTVWQWENYKFTFTCRRFPMRKKSRRNGREILFERRRNKEGRKTFWGLVPEGSSHGCFHNWARASKGGSGTGSEKTPFLMVKKRAPSAAPTLITRVAYLSWGLSLYCMWFFVVLSFSSSSSSSPRMRMERKFLTLESISHDRLPSRKTKQRKISSVLPAVTDRVYICSRLLSRALLFCLFFVNSYYGLACRLFLDADALSPSIESPFPSPFVFFSRFYCRQSEQSVPGVHKLRLRWREFNLKENQVTIATSQMVFGFIVRRAERERWGSTTRIKVYTNVEGIRANGFSPLVGEMGGRKWFTPAI